MITSNDEAGMALIYCRVSTQRQDDEGTSLQTQEEACSAHARSLDLEPAITYREIYSGAELFDRPRLNELRDAVRTGKYRAVIVYAIDRLTRTQGLTAYLLVEFEKYGTSLISVTDPLESTATGKFLLATKEFVAEIEREKIRERTMRGKHAHVRAGKVQTWGFAPYGYRIDKRAGVRVIEDSEATLVRQIFEWVGIEQASLSVVARRLNEMGIPSPGHDRYERRGPNWAPRWGISQLSRMLRRPEYKGVAYALTTRAEKRGKRVPRDRKDWVELPERSTPPIVSAELWNIVQDRVVALTTAKSRNAQHRYLLRGIIFCGRCGRPMRSTPDHGRFIYRCSSREEAGGACGGKAVPAGNVIPRGRQPRDARGALINVDDESRERLSTLLGIDDWAWGQARTILQNPALIQLEVNRQRRSDPDSHMSKELADVTKAHANAERKQQRVLRSFSESTGDSLPWQVVEQEISRLEEEKRRLTARRTELEGRLRMTNSTALQVQTLTDYCARVAHNLDCFDFDDKRQALEALGARVYGDGRSSWKIEWNFRSSCRGHCK